MADPQAFGVIFDRHFDDIFRFAVRRLGAQAGEELAAEVFLVAFSQRHRYDAGRPDARPWLFGIASGLASNFRRSESRRWAAYSRVVTLLPTAAAGSDPGDSVVSSQLLDALSALSKDIRETVLLYAWADLSYEQIAAAQVIPVGTVRSRLNRARGCLRRALRAQEGGVTDD